MIKCTSCGRDNEDHAKFCYNCGRPVAGEEPTVPPSKPLPRPSVPSKVTPSVAPIRVPSPGMCFYHSRLPAGFICGRCGRPICKACAQGYQQLVFCPQCYTYTVPR